MALTKYSPASVVADVLEDKRGKKLTTFKMKRRKGYRAFASGFYDLIEAETAPIVDELKVRQAESIREDALTELREFIAEQRALLQDISNKSEIDMADLEDIFGIKAQQERDELFDYIFEELSDTPAAQEGAA